MAKTHQRLFALIMALLFLGTSVAITALIILQVRQQSKDEQTLQNDQQTISQEGQLQGTKLQDFTPIETPVTELQIIDIKEGSGEPVKASDTVTAHYTGAYAVSGEIFESSKDGGQPATFPLSQVIQGWQQGVPGMKVGGVRRLIIPGPLAYGEAPEGYAPGVGGQPLGPLVFDIELVKIGE